MQASVTNSVLIGPFSSPSFPLASLVNVVFPRVLCVSLFVSSVSALFLTLPPLFIFVSGPLFLYLLPGMALTVQLGILWHLVHPKNIIVNNYLLSKIITYREIYDYYYYYV